MLSRGLRGSVSMNNMSNMRRSTDSSPLKRKKRKEKTKNVVKVAVRVRPLTKQEKSASDWSTVNITNNQVVTLSDPKDITVKNDPLLRSRESKYAFDLALGPSGTTEDLYNGTVKAVVSNVLNGKHGTIFAYGATGSGKTYTMSGTETNPGVMFFTISDLFKETQSKPHRIEVTASYLEIYNEVLIDLLMDEPTTVDLREDPIKGVCVAGITEYTMQSAKDVFEVLAKGAKNRTTDSHSLNEASSRSHAVLIINVAQFQNGKKEPSKSSNLTMIDLAGSERAKKTGTTKKMLGEAAKINRSLLALANCINALGQNKKKGLFIPYRDSKLTRLLKESLGGGAYTVMIANVSAAASQFDESRETLLYANRAKNIKVTYDMLRERETKARINQKHQQFNSIVSDMAAELSELQSTLEPHRRRLSIIPSPMKPPKKDLSIEVPKQPPPGSASSEQRQTQELVQSIVQNFQDRIQLRQSLAELQEIDAVNDYDLAQAEAVIKDWETQHPGQLPPRHVVAARIERNSLQESISSNKAYHESQLAQLAELGAEGAALRHKIQAMDFTEERQRIVHLTLDRCVLELQKIDLELRERCLLMEVADKDDEITYYVNVLKQSGVHFAPYDHSQRARKLQERLKNEPMPELPNLNKPNPSVHTYLATPKRAPDPPQTFAARVQRELLAATYEDGSSDTDSSVDMRSSGRPHSWNDSVQRLLPHGLNTNPHHIHSARRRPRRRQSLLDMSRDISEQLKGETNSPPSDVESPHILKAEQRGRSDPTTSETSPRKRAFAFNVSSETPSSDSESVSHRPRPPRRAQPRKISTRRTSNRDRDDSRRSSQEEKSPAVVEQAPVPPEVDLNDGLQELVNQYDPRVPPTLAPSRRETTRPSPSSTRQPRSSLMMKSQSMGNYPSATGHATKQSGDALALLRRKKRTTRYFERQNGNSNSPDMRKSTSMVLAQGSS